MVLVNQVRVRTDHLDVSLIDALPIPAIVVEPLGDLPQAIVTLDGVSADSGYNQGMGGAKEKGEKVNKPYVDAVIAAAKEFGELDAIKPDKAEERRYTVKANDSLWADLP